MDAGAPYLIAEDVLLLVLDPVSGRPVNRLWPELFGGCLLADLAMSGAVSVDPGGFFRFPEVSVTTTAPSDPLLAAAASRLGHRSMRAEDAGRTLGNDAHQALLDRLGHRGVLERREERCLGRRREVWPALDTTRRDQVGHCARAIAEGGPPDARGLMVTTIVLGAGLGERVLALPKGVAQAFTLFQRRRHRALTDPTAVELVRTKVLEVCVTACGTGRRGDLDLPWDPGDSWFD